MLALNTCAFMDNGYFLFMGFTYPFIATLDLIHTLAYKGMGVFPDYGTDLSVQLWIAARYLHSLSLLVALVFTKRRLCTQSTLDTPDQTQAACLRPLILVLSYSLLTGLILGTIFYWRIFPICYIEGSGLTAFKKISEYLISGFLMLSAGLLLKQRARFDKYILRLLIASLVTLIMSELAFTLYIDLYGHANLIGHLFKVTAFYLVYIALIETSLKKPYRLIFRDLKQSEEALRESTRTLQISESRYRLLFNKANDLIMVYSLSPTSQVHGHFTEINEVARLTLKYTSEELLQMSLQDIIAEDNLAHLAKQEEKLLYEHQNLFRTTLVTKDQTRVPVEIHAHLFDSHGRPTVLAIARDITKHQQMEQYVIRTERLAAMGQLAATLAHEINNPLQAIGNSLELVLDFPIKASEQRLYLIATRQEVERLQTLTQRILNFASPVKDKAQPVSVPQVIDYTLNLTRKKLNQAQVQLILDVPDDLPPVQASFDPLAQVFLNLILNAIEAMPQGGVLHIQATPSTDTLAITFEDTGPGLPTETPEKLFEPFFTTKDQGTGLGIPVSHQIIQQYGGSLTAVNGQQGGAVFTVTLPTTSSTQPNESGDLLI